MYASMYVAIARDGGLRFHHQLQNMRGSRFCQIGLLLIFLSPFVHVLNIRPAMGLVLII